jgi:hypothetical protein
MDIVNILTLTPIQIDDEITINISDFGMQIAEGIIMNIGSGLSVFSLPSALCSAP